MTLKVVQGLVGAPQTSNSTQNIQAKAPAQPSTNTPTVQAQQFNSDAVVSNIRAGAAKPLGTGERIKSPEEAQKVANKVAAEIERSDDALDAHAGLERGVGRAAGALA